MGKEKYIEPEFGNVYILVQKHVNNKTKSRLKNILITFSKLFVL